jgi:large conductance mechanosensitive channel
MLQEFKQFLLRGNVVDLAVGVVIGSAFGTVVSSLVNDVLTPLISVLTRSPDLGAYAVTIADTTIAYGKFVNSMISFFIIAAAVFFFIVKPMNTLIARTRRGAPADPTTKKCPECRAEIPIDAKRCMHCTQAVT